MFLKHEENVLFWFRRLISQVSFSLALGTLICKYCFTYKGGTNLAFVTELPILGDTSSLKIYFHHTSTTVALVLHQKLFLAEKMLFYRIKNPQEWDNFWGITDAIMKYCSSASASNFIKRSFSPSRLLLWDHTLLITLQNTWWYKSAAESMSQSL